MKIVDITLTNLLLPLPSPGLRPGWLGGHKHYPSYPVQLVQVFTDEEITGIGLSERVSLSVVDQVKQQLTQQTIDPFELEKLSLKLGGLPAGVEIALYDIAGKLSKKPIYQLLGGYQNKVKAYAATINLKEPEERAKDALARAYANQVSHRVLPIWSHRTTYRVAQALERLNVYWLEEPLHREDLTGLAELAAKMQTLMIAGAEGEIQLQRFKQFFQQGCFDIVQPDTIWAGISSVKKIGVLAEAFNKLIIPHTHSICGLGLASSLQVIGSMTKCPYVEFGYEPPIITPKSRDRILKEPIQIDKDGYVHIPRGPSLGVELNQAFVEQYTAS